MRVLQQVVFIILLVLFLAAIPWVIHINPIDKSIDWDFTRLGQIYKEFFQTLAGGGLGTYTIGSQTREISGDIPYNFTTSLIILLGGVIIAVIFSLLFGVFLSRFKLSRLINILLNILSSIPDFILIIFGLIIAVEFYQITGVRVLSLKVDGGALNLWFPICLSSLAPTLYLFKLVAVKYYQISGEDYIRTAVSKGMDLNYINLHHVYKNIEPFIIAELTKIISLAVGNMFIIEYLLNVRGITKFIFQSSQFQPIAIGLFSMLLISLIVFLSVRIVLFMFKRGIVHD
ncbi:ABC transporter permease subunit [Neobacillus sp. LXY-1]|uniref:ABC transporter permease subunit n=1 Tax=Neobacillus sp. LXY-1 TaxID=3379133 RepID=UPI003EE3DD93